MDPLLEARNISKAFWGVRALDGASLRVARGEVHALTGENGAGKSTLMRVVAGFDEPDSGEVLFGGRALAMIHQELLAFPDLSVAENVRMGREPGAWRVDKAAMNREAGRLLALLGVDIDPRARMGDLTVAEMQAAEIARALGREADLLIMDEPTSALSDREAEALFRVIGDLKQRGVSVIYISHRMEEVFRLADTITVMRDGRVVATKPVAALTPGEVIALMVGRELNLEPAPQRPTAGGIALEVRGLGRAGRFRDVSFTLRRGEILGLAGLMGARRTDVAAAIYGLAPADRGELVLNGARARIGSPAEALARGIAMVTEDRKEHGFVPEMPVRDNLTLSSLPRCCRGPFIRHREETRVAIEQIRTFGIRTTGPDQPVKNLSGGNQQKVVIAKALLADPGILILDEPTRGIDVGAKAEIHALIRRLASEGKAILMVSSEMNEILALCGRILVMREGTIAAEVRAGETTPEQILKYAMGH